MLNNHPALSLLLAVGFLQFWLMPAIAWVLLKGHRDTAAKFWFAGTACYALTASLFVVQTVLPREIYSQISFLLVTTMLICLVESLRRELQSTPTRWTWFAAVLVLNSLLMAWTVRNWGLEGLRATQVAVITCWDLGCVVLLTMVIRKHRSRALLFVMLGFVTVVVTNMLRLHAFWSRGETTQLLSYSTTANVGFVANYISVVLYSFGYWGFVVEKNRKALQNEMAQRVRAQDNEQQALEREQFTLGLLREREELIAQLAKMQRAVQAGALAASIAHEISQPLTSVRLSAEEAGDLQRQGLYTDRMAELMQRIAKESQRASSTIQIMRDIFGGQQSVPEERPIDDIVRAMLALLQKRLQNQAVHLVTDLQAPVRAQVGSGELEHVVLNLLTNSLDAFAQQASRDPVIRISSRVHQETVILTIQDNGPGVPEPMRDKLFELYAGSKPGGLGLGLWLSRYIVERHGGQLVLDPVSEHAGASFTARLPRLFGVG